MLPATLCHQQRAESVFDCAKDHETIAKYHEAELPLRTSSLKVALPEGMEIKLRHGALPRPLHSREVENIKDVKLMSVNILNFSQSSHTLQYLSPVLTVQVYIVQLNYCIVVCCLYVHKSYFI